MKRGQTLFLVSFLAVPLALFAMFVLSPYLQAFYLGLTDWTGFTPTYNVVGTRNFEYIFGIGAPPDTRFWIGLLNNLILLIAVPVLTIIISLFFASMLNLSGATKGGQIKGVAGSQFYQVLFFIPQVISVAALGIMFQQFFQPNGLLNSFIVLLNRPLGLLGLSAPTPVWLSDHPMAVLIAVMVWMQVGFYMVYFTAAMASVPRELLEAAAIDRAGKWSTFVRVTLPLLWPAVQTAFIYLAILSLDALVIVQVMTIGPGGPDNRTWVMGLSLLSSRNEGYFGYASAQGVLIFIATMGLALLTLRMTRREQVEL